LKITFGTQILLSRFKKNNLYQLVKSKNKTKEYKMVKIEPDEISSIIRQQIAQYSEEVKSLLLEQYFK
jgi:hypothetical protein